MYSETGANSPCRLLFSCQIKGVAENTVNAHTIHHAIHCISYGLLRASHSRNPTGDRLRRSVAAFAPPLHTLCERMWLTARAYSHFRAACASLRAHTCCLRNRIQSLTRASRAMILSAYSKSLYSKPHTISCATYCISPCVTSLLRSFRAANRYSHSRVASHRSMLIPVVVANVLAHW